MRIKIKFVLLSQPINLVPLIENTFSLTGLMKCALQEFQHMFPHLTTRIKVKPPVPPNNEEIALFLPMECPILPLDTNFSCSDMLHESFDEENGPLWRVQLITEASMESACLVSLRQIC